MADRDSIFDSTTFRVLLVTFAIIAFLAIIGLILGSLFDTNDDIFHEAIRIIGIGGPAGSGVNSVSDAMAKWRTIPPPQDPSKPNVMPPMMKPPGG